MSSAQAIFHFEEQVTVIWTYNLVYIVGEGNETKIYLSIEYNSFSSLHFTSGIVIALSWRTVASLRRALDGFFVHCMYEMIM